MFTPFPLAMIYIFLLFLCSCSAGNSELDVRIAQVDGVYFPYPVEPPNTFTAAVVSVHSEQPIYVQAGGCKRTGLCKESNFRRCCPPKDCNGAVSNDPNKCVCPSRPDRVCVDPDTPFVCTFLAHCRGLTSPDNGDEYLYNTPWIAASTLTFEIPLVSDCNTVIIDTGNLIGDWDLYLCNLSQTPEGDFLNTVLAASSFGPDAMALCAAKNESGPWYFTNNTLDFWLDNIPDDKVPRITGYLSGYGRLNLTVSGTLERSRCLMSPTELTEPNGLVPYNKGAHHKLGTSFFSLALR